MEISNRESDDLTTNAGKGEEARGETPTVRRERVKRAQGLPKTKKVGSKLSQSSRRKKD